MIKECKDWFSKIVGKKKESAVFLYRSGWDLGSTPGLSVQATSNSNMVYTATNFSPNSVATFFPESKDKKPNRRIRL